MFCIFTIVIHRVPELKWKLLWMCLLTVQPNNPVKEQCHHGWVLCAGWMKRQIRLSFFAHHLLVALVYLFKWRDVTFSWLSGLWKCHHSGFQACVNYLYYRIIMLLAITFWLSLICYNDSPVKYDISYNTGQLHLHTMNIPITRCTTLDIGPGSLQWDMLLHVYIILYNCVDMQCLYVYMIIFDIFSSMVCFLYLSSMHKTFDLCANKIKFWNVTSRQDISSCLILWYVFDDLHLMSFLS